MRRPPSFLTLLVIGGSVTIGLGWIERHRQLLSREAARAHAEKDAIIAARLKTDVPNFSVAHDSEQGRAIRDEIQRVQDQIASLEQHALARRTEMRAASERRMATAAQAAGARDPAQGMTKLELFQNVGRDTAAAAFQTLVWAALKGERQTLAAGLALDDRALQRANDLLARLPEPARAQLSPEKIAALWFEGTVLDVPAAQILRQESQDDEHVTLLVRGGIGDSSTVNMVHSATGWQLVVPQHGLETIEKQVAGGAAPAPHP